MTKRFHILLQITLIGVSLCFAIAGTWPFACFSTFFAGINHHYCFKEW